MRRAFKKPAIAQLIPVFDEVDEATLMDCMMDKAEKIKLEEELEELYSQLQRYALMLNRRLAQAQLSTNLLKGDDDPAPFDSPDSLSEPFMDLLVRYKQAQQRYAQQSGHTQGI